MARRFRDLVPGGIYHVYARGVRKLPILASDDDKAQYLFILGLVVRELGWRVLAYCVMDNHVHLLVQTPKPDLPRGMQVAHGDFARYVNKMTNEVGHVFEDRYGSTRATTPGAVMYIASYVVLNPVRAGMCERPEQYKWSSHAAVIGDAPRPTWLASDLLLGHFEGDGTSALDRYVHTVDAIRVMGVQGFEPRPHEI
jgi:REP element-mobilizing transposase RayT